MSLSQLVVCGSDDGESLPLNGAGVVLVSDQEVRVSREVELGERRAQTGSPLTCMQL